MIIDFIFLLCMCCFNSWWIFFLKNWLMGVGKVRGGMLVNILKWLNFDVFENVILFLWNKEVFIGVDMKILFMNVRKDF